MHDSSEWVGDEMVIMQETYFGIGKSVIQPNVALEIDGCVVRSCSEILICN